ncbi:uncharacterized protein LOC124910740 [Impatiens glandulifera]|uniref:uncharacterized protein LOC124910740 n=1 Tax=Impatiens glandulifera TaxID=253017 RepID=UPI001FB0D3F1|nr:uncharacterized protein LOC124910740 [Impatiens glandulifera]
MDFQKKRVQLLLFIIGVVSLSMVADKCRHLVGEEASSTSGKFTIFDCLDGSTGSLACAVKESVKIYFYNIRSSHVERSRHEAIEKALIEALSQGLIAQEAAKQAQKEGAKAAKLATRKAKRIIGPIISSGWDFFEALYYGGTVAEGLLRGSGTLVGAYAGGYIGEQKFGRVGYLVGSEFGGWVGGRIGLMVYDVVNGVHFLLQFGEADGDGLKNLQEEEEEEIKDNNDLESTTTTDAASFESAEEETTTDAASFESAEEETTTVYENYDETESYESPTPPTYESREDL